MLYTDYAERFKSLSDSQFGQLIRCICHYQITGERPEINDNVVSLSFEIIKPDLDRNNQKYSETCERRKEAGRKGGLARASKAKQTKQMLANQANATFAKQIKQSQANQAENENENENDNENDNDINNIKDIVFNEGIDIDKVKCKEKTTKKEKPVYYPNDEALNQAFMDFIAHRKQIKKPMSDRAITLAINQLNKLSGGDNDRAIEIINQSILNGWQGLFELSNKNSKNTQPQSLAEKWGLGV